MKDLVVRRKNVLHAFRWNTLCPLTTRSVRHQPDTPRMNPGYPVILSERSERRDLLVRKDARPTQTWYVFSMSKQRIASLRNGCNNHGASPGKHTMSYVEPSSARYPRDPSLRHERHAACSG